MPQGFRVGFNLTGGTKLMFAGALAACRKIGGVPFYFETRDHSLIFLRDFKSMPIRGVDNVDLFFQANGFTVVRKGRWEENPQRRQRATLTERLWDDRRLIATVYDKLKQFTDYRTGFLPFDIKHTVQRGQDTWTVEIILEKTGRAYLNLAGEEFTFEHCTDFGKYLAGGWLEEYTYLILEPLLIDGKIRDLRIGLEVNWDSHSVGPNVSPVQEFDVSFTDGKRLFIVECKAGAVCSEHIYKLQNCVRVYGGTDARGIMACAFPPHHGQTRKRLESARNIDALYGSDIPNKIASLVLGNS